jgi:cytochrome c oxidase subunit 2
MLEGIQGVSTFAEQIDNTFIIVTGITLFLFIITIGSMLYFVYKYRASKNPKENAKNIKHYTPIEIAWTVIPTILMMVVFYYGLESLRVQRTMPSAENSITVKVLAQRWFWTFEYENGKKSNELTVPIDTNIKLEMTAPKTDVLHSFFVPAFRIKEDVIPGQKTMLWFNATKIGRYDIQCAEYCGTRHSFMRSMVNVQSKDDFNQFITPKKVETIQTAPELFTQLGCVACHSTDGSILVGPSFKDIYNQEGKVKTNNVLRLIKKDEKYLRNSIVNPNSDIVEGYFPNIMPSFKNQIKEVELETIIRYFKGEKTPLKTEIKTKISAEEIVENNGCRGCHSIDGSTIVGPSFKNIYNRKVTIIRDGKILQIVSEEKYLKNSILNSKVDVVENYPNIMPEFKDILKEEEVDAIIEYFKTLK